MLSQNILGLLAIAAGYQQKTADGKRNTLKEIDAAWDDLPAEKLNCRESAIVATMMFKEHLFFNQIEKAKAWAKVLIDDVNRPKTGEQELLMGKIYYAEGLMDKAKTEFMEAFTKSNGREFEGEDKKYLELIKK